MLLTGLEFTLVVLLLEVLLEVFVDVLLEAEFFTRLVGDTKFVFLLVVVLEFLLAESAALLCAADFLIASASASVILLIGMKPLLYALMLFCSWYR